MTSRYLDWPEGWPRTPDHKRCGGYHFKTTVKKAAHDVEQEVRRLGGRSLRISVDLPPLVSGDGFHAGRNAWDPGVAIYFMLRGRPHVMACDTYQRTEHNLRALALTVESLRAIERHGASGILDRAMAGFAALPPGSPGTPERPHRPWWEVLGVPQIGGVRFEEIGGDPRHPMRKPLLAMAESLYRDLVPKAHPDRGGSTDAMVELAAAIEECRAALGKHESDKDEG